MKNKLTARLAALALVGGIALGGSVASAQPAEAQTGPFGGRIYLSNSSKGNLKVSGGLKKNSNGTYKMLSPIGWLAPGQNSRTHAHIYDADAFLAPKGCKTKVTIGSDYWYAKPGSVTKIGDFTKASVLVRC